MTDWYEISILNNMKSLWLDLKVSEGVGMVQHKTLDQYLTLGKVSTRSIQCISRYGLLKTL